MKELNICYVTNLKFAIHTAVCITSLCENNSSHNIKFHILHADLSDTVISNFLDLKNRYENVKLFFYKVDATLFDKFSLTISYITKETYFRYLIADLLSDVDKVLYLDGDTIVNGNISELFDIDLSGYYCAGSRDIFIEEIGHKQHLGLKGTYINAGVILFNLNEIRASDAVEKLFEISNNREHRFQDQDAINIVFNGKIKEIDCVYNFTRQHQKLFPQKVKSVKICHYVGPQKPWKRFTLNRLKRLYFKYKKITPQIYKKIKVGLLVDEYFGKWRTAFGGYGFLAKEIIAKHLPCDDIELEVILGRQKNNLFWASSRIIEGIKVWRLPRLESLMARWLSKADYDCWLSIEMCYDFVIRLDSNKRRKLILWIQDPRPKSAWQKIGKMKKVEDHCFYNQKNYDCVKKWFDAGKVKFITQGKTLSPLARELYSLPDCVKPELLQNPIDIDFNYELNIAKKEKIVVFLGRLEAQKRAWIFCEIAKLMPEYKFYVMGKFYRYVDENKEALKEYLNGKIKNLKFCGHLVGKEKIDLLKRARVLVNTSIWEGIPISWLEALSYGTLIVSAFDREELVSRFGKYVGEIVGDGDDSAKKFVEPIRFFMENDSAYNETALSAISYTRKNHSFTKFEDSIRNIIHNFINK